MGGQAPYSAVPKDTASKPAEENAMRTNDGEMVSKPNSFVTLIGVIFDRSSSDCYVRSLVGIVS